MKNIKCDSYVNLRLREGSPMWKFYNSLLYFIFLSPGSSDNDCPEVFLIWDNWDFFFFSTGPPTSGIFYSAFVLATSSGLQWLWVYPLNYFGNQSYIGVVGENVPIKSPMAMMTKRSPAEEQPQPPLPHTSASVNLFLHLPLAWPHSSPTSQAWTWKR